jgi:hypothetical protein
MERPAAPCAPSDPGAGTKGPVLGGLPGPDIPAFFARVDKTRKKGFSLTRPR